MGSGEALIDALDGESGDRRRLIFEGEFARILSVMQRDGQTLSPILRTTWDTGRADIQTRAKERHVRGCHLSLIAHITAQELLRRMNDVELDNGLANRMLFCCARRSKLLPFGGGSPELGAIARELKRAVDQARQTGDSRMDFDPEARPVWEAVYGRLTAARPGMLGSITSRSDTQCLRVALVFALLDAARKVRADHIRAALAVIDYCHESARYIWGDRTGNPIADKALAAIRTAGESGCTRTEIYRDVFGNNADAEDIERALNQLIGLGLIRSQQEDTGGRPSVRYSTI
jgi:hypothetical protein